MTRLAGTRHTSRQTDDSDPAELFSKLLAVVDRPFKEDMARGVLRRELNEIRKEIVQREELDLWVEGTFVRPVVARLRAEHRAQALRRAYAEVERDLGRVVRARIDRTQASEVSARVLGGEFGDPEDPATHRRVLRTLSRHTLDAEVRAWVERALDSEVFLAKQAMVADWADQCANAAESERLDALKRLLAADLPHLSPSEILLARGAHRALVEALPHLPLATAMDLVRLAGSARRSLWLLLRGDEDLSQDHIEELERSTITPEHAALAGIFSETWMPLVDAIRRQRARDDEYLVFPYHRPGHVGPVAFRIKGSRTGYRQPTETLTPVYYPPLTLRHGRLDGHDVLIWTEGEKKALALDRLAYSVVGLPGIWNFHDKAHRDATGELRLHPWIRDDVRLAERVHVIAFDPGLRTNPDVLGAARRLAMLLWRAGAADVRLVEWPEVAPSIGGVDDLAHLRGDEAVHTLIGGARTLPHGLICIPQTISQMTRITPEQKVVYGALWGAASDDGLVENVSMPKLGEMVGKSRQGVSEHLNNLARQGLVRCIAGRTRRVRGRFKAERNRYRLLRHAHHRKAPTLNIRERDLKQHRSACALVLAALPRQGEIRTGHLAEITGLPPRTLRDALVALGPRVSRRRGYVWLS